MGFNGKKIKGWIKKKSAEAKGIDRTNAIGDWISPSGFGGGVGSGGIYSPYNLGKERKRAKRKRSLY